MNSDMVSPRWSLYGENQVGECALKSPVMIVLLLLVR